MSIFIVFKKVWHKELLELLGELDIRVKDLYIMQSLFLQLTYGMKTILVNIRKNETLSRIIMSFISGVKLYKKDDTKKTKVLTSIDIQSHRN